MGDHAAMDPWVRVVEVNRRDSSAVLPGDGACRWSRTTNPRPAVFAQPLATPSALDLPVTLRQDASLARPQSARAACPSPWTSSVCCGCCRPPAGRPVPDQRPSGNDQKIRAVDRSTSGVTAAQAAGIACVAVPNLVTAHFDLGAADLVLPTLTARPLAELWSDQLVHADTERR